MRPGLYEQLVTKALEQDLSQLADPRLFFLESVDPEDSHAAIAQFLEHVLVGCLAAFRGEEATEKQTRLADRIVRLLIEELGDDESARMSIASPLRRLLAIREAVRDKADERPDTPLARSALLTGTRLDPSLGSQFRKEIVTSDRVDILCSFIRWSGLRVILEPLRALAERGGSRGPRIRVITTSYMGATDPRAIEELSRLPNTEIRVSYDTKRTRLHAKAYVFHRDSGFGSAYVGSANLSSAALSEGLEWTTKISHYELPYLWNKVIATFETYWEDDEFTEFDSDAPHRLRQAIRHERASSTDNPTGVLFDLRPFPFQEEILDVLTAEREIQGKYRHLVVAATGTGKTMIAAFDYSQYCRDLDHRPSLLFVAHRQEILQQALGTFRAVLRDQNFGDLLVGGREPSQYTHLFCSIQSYNLRELRRVTDRYEYIVVDEFHHAAAPSYQRLLEDEDPKILLGLTATPERSDQMDVLSWFGGRASAEIRLPDAISRRLLCPFQYFGITDSVDLDGLTWQRGGYRADDLNRLYTGNDTRAMLILQKVQEILISPTDTRGIGFCCSVAHADFMARYFSDHGVPSIALSSESTPEERQSAQEKLRSKHVNFVFVVDLYNEGVDIPEADTVLFLRPTESLTVYLQQFGRGLRLHPEKDCLTVLDFIGAHRKEFRFAPRLRALSTKPANRVDQEVEDGFPHLPSGCVIQLERVAQQRVLDNVRASIGLVRPRLIASLRDLGRYLGRTPRIAEALEYLDISLDELLKRGLWSQLLADADLAESPTDTDKDRLAKGLRRLCHIDSPVQIHRLRELLDGQIATSEDDRRLLEMLHVTLWADQCQQWSLEDSLARLRENDACLHDLKTILELRLQHAPSLHVGRLSDKSGPLDVHAQYTRDEILIGLGHWTMNHRPRMSEGVLHVSKTKVDAFFVTLQKTEEEYSPTTMYEDYLISHDQFHWQSQSNTSASSPTGKRYIEHQKLGYTPLLFVREVKKMPSGVVSPYYYLGPCDHLSHQGSRPVSIVWKLRHHVPARIFRTIARQNVG